jgi:hypothetical protein
MWFLCEWLAYYINKYIEHFTGYRMWWGWFNDDHVVASQSIVCNSQAISKALQA